MLSTRPLFKVRIKQEENSQPTDDSERHWYNPNEEYIVSEMHGELKDTYYQVVYGRHSINLIQKTDVDILERID